MKAGAGVVAHWLMPVTSVVSLDGETPLNSTVTLYFSVVSLTPQSTVTLYFSAALLSIPVYWQASETLSVYQFEICNMYIYIYMDVCKA